MKSRPITALVMVGAVLTLTLTSCTPSPRFGVLLNADDTIDFVLCDGYRSEGDLSVDYLVDRSDAEDPEWTLTSSLPSLAERRVISYGEEPEFFETTHLEPPPPEWVSVGFGWGYAHRSELTVGEWFWSTNDYPWVPDRPCLSGFSGRDS